MPLTDRDPVLQAIERDLREAQAFDYLKALRKSLAEKIALQRGQKQDLNGQKAKTRSYTVIDRITSEIQTIAKRYNATYDALNALGGKVNPKLQHLKKEDLSAKDVFEYSRQLGRGSATTISWIWRQIPLGGEVESDSWLEEGMFTLNSMQRPTLSILSIARAVP